MVAWLSARIKEGEAARLSRHEPEILQAQATRMLADPRAERFAESFSRQWLQLKKVGMFAPDSNLYPEYDQYLEQSAAAAELHEASRNLASNQQRAIHYQYQKERGLAGWIDAVDNQQRIVRLFPGDWPVISIPLEERLWPARD